MTAVIAAGLAGTAFAATRYGETYVPPGRRHDDFLDQVVPPYNEFVAIKKALAEVAADPDPDTAGREGALEAVEKLALRGAANRDRFRGVATTDPELRAMAEALVRRNRADPVGRSRGPILRDRRPGPGRGPRGRRGDGPGETGFRTGAPRLSDRAWLARAPRAPEAVDRGDGSPSCGVGPVADRSRPVISSWLDPAGLS